jgi:hypothetical protein
MAAGSQTALAAIAKMRAIGMILTIRSHFRGGSGLTGIRASFDFMIEAFQNGGKD